MLVQKNQVKGRWQKAFTDDSLNLIQKMLTQCTITKFLTDQIRATDEHRVCFIRRVAPRECKQKRWMDLRFEGVVVAGVDNPTPKNGNTITGFGAVNLRDKILVCFDMHHPILTSGRYKPFILRIHFYINIPIE